MSTTITPPLMPWAPVHYGVRVTDLGEGSDFAVAGHVAPRRALAAVLRYLRVDCGIPTREVASWLPQPRIHHRWVIPVDAGTAVDPEEEAWVWADDDLRYPITVVEL